MKRYAKTKKLFILQLVRFRKLSLEVFGATCMVLGILINSDILLCTMVYLFIIK